jgi:hypothetical protein
MKKITTILFTFVFTITLFAQTKFPSDEMQGYWFSPKTKQLFVIKNDARVKYSNGNGKFVEMEVMSQSFKPIESGDNAAFMKLYYKKNDKMVYHLTTYKSDKTTVLQMTESGNRKKIIYLYNLDDMIPKEVFTEDK